MGGAVGLTYGMVSVLDNGTGDPGSILGAFMNEKGYFHSAHCRNNVNLIKC